MRARWFSKRALLFHLAVLIWTPGCLIAGWWQVNVALSGNELSYLYSVEWPVFAIFGAFVWWRMIHDDPESLGIRGLRRARESAEAEGRLDPAANAGLERHVEDEDEALRAYNDYLESLAQKPKSWRH